MKIRVYNSKQEVVKTFYETMTLANWLGKNFITTESLIDRGGGIISNAKGVFAISVVNENEEDDEIRKQECIKRRKVKSCSECLHYKEC